MTNIKFPETDIIGCRFPECTGRNGAIEVNMRSKEYFYKLLPGTSRPNKGDLVVTSCINGFQVCVVTTLDALYEAKDMAYAVGVVDANMYREELARQEQKKKLHAQLMQMKKELEASIALEVFAERSPEFKALLEAYNKL